MTYLNCRMHWLKLLLVFSITCGLPGCSRSPSKVVEEMGEDATKRRLVQFRAAFSPQAQNALKQQFSEDGLSEAEGWRDLMIGYLGSDRKAPEVIAEEKTGADNAIVKVTKEVKPPRGSKEPIQTITQELALAKVDDEWKLALGPMKYTVEAAKKEEKEQKEKPLKEDDELELDGKGKKAQENVKDIDLDDF